jgi:hypothetical protein
MRSARSVEGHQTATSESTQAFLLVGALFQLPAAAINSDRYYCLFRGKVRAEVVCG